MRHEAVAERDNIELNYNVEEKQYPIRKGKLLKALR